MMTDREVVHVVMSMHDLQGTPSTFTTTTQLGENRPKERKQVVFNLLSSYHSTNHPIHHPHHHQQQQHVVDVTHDSNHDSDPDHNPNSNSSPNPNHALCIHKVPMSNHNNPYELTLNSALLVHTDEYVSFIRRAWTEWKQHVDDKSADLYMCHNGNRHGGDTTMFLPAQIAPRWDVDVRGNGHCLSKGSTNIQGQICYYATDRFTPILCDTLIDLQYDLLVIETAIDLLVRLHQDTTTTSAPPVLYALTSHPGHHAASSTFAGFCYFNNAAITCKLLLQKGFHCIGLLDVDYHAGDGSLSIFYSSSDVSFVSLHIDPNLDYPYNRGFPEHTGSGEGEGYSLNVCLPAQTAWPAYKEHVCQALQRFAEQECDCLVVSLGVDTLKGDPETSPQGGMCLLPPDYRELGRLIRSYYPLPTLFVSEGGYLLDLVPQCVLNTILPSNDNQVI